MSKYDQTLEQQEQALDAEAKCRYPDCDCNAGTGCKRPPFIDDDETSERK